MEVEAAAFEMDPPYYRNPDFHLLQKACDKLKLELTEREDIYSEMWPVLHQRLGLHEDEDIPEHIDQMLRNALDIWMGEARL